ncbi:phosphodiesterase 4D interacting protein centrosomin isoform X4 [Rhodnius prolixus]|uniref:phosphodiesterase 4D interacting protein centrosomin isoform X4 n=1 Tax=Rhodnius prolixus TaxID=13249 RepID=UPI003D18E753
MDVNTFSFSTTVDMSEITLDDQLNEAKAYVTPTSSGTAQASPDKRSPCTRGKTMRDFEEELSELKRENFDLKMRIYIMEEQQDLFQGVENIDEIYHINSSLKKEVEDLRKQVSDKDDLILKAGDAMNLLVNKHKEEVSLIKMQAQQEVETYKERLDILQQELMDSRDKSLYSQQKLDDSSSVMFTLPFTLPAEKKPFECSKYEEVVVGLTSQVNDLECELKEKNKQLQDAFRTIEKLNGEVMSLKEIENNLRSEIVSKAGTISLLENELAEKDMDIQALHNKITAFESKLKETPGRDQAAQEEQLPTEEMQKLQLEKELTNYQKLKSKYDSVRMQNDQLTSQIVELHKRLNELQIELQNRGAINMDLHQQLEMLKTRNTDLQEEARMLRVVSDCTLECGQSVTSSAGDGNSRKLAQVTAQLQDVWHKFQLKELELMETKKENLKNVVQLQKVAKQNKSLTKDIENMKVSLEHREHHANVELGRGEQERVKCKELSKKLKEVGRERDMLQVVMDHQVQKLLEKVKGKELQIEEYKGDEQQPSDKEVRIEELEKQVASLKLEIDAAISSEVNVQKKMLCEELEEKKQEIEHLNEELRKRTFNLQELVNKELWDKNREIERLNKVCEKKQTEVVNLRNQLQSQEEELGLLNWKLQELGEHISANISKITERKEEPVSYREKCVAEIEENNAKINDIEYLKKKLSVELQKNEDMAKECLRWKLEAEQNDKSRKELLNACTSLMTRLEELATFLDSLLPLLGAKKRRMLQQVIDRSREASRSVSISFLDQTLPSNNLSNTSAAPILPDFSQVDFCSEDDILDVTLIPKENVDEQNVEVVQIREQLESLVEKLKEARLSPEQKKKEHKCASVWTVRSHQGNTSLELPQIRCDSVILEDITEGSLLESFESDKEDTYQNLTYAEKKSITVAESQTGGEQFQEKSNLGSESEGWSEPDRNVSMARIGLREEMSAVMPSSDESSDSMPKPCHPPSSRKRHEEVRRLHMKVKHLEKLNRSLLTELRVREKIVDAVHAAHSSEIHVNGLVTKTLLEEIKKQREKLLSSLSHNEFIRNQLEGALTSSIGEMEGKKNLISQLKEMSLELERSCSLCLDLERRCISLESERTTLKKILEGLRTEADTARASLKEKENEMLEAQCSLLDLRNKNLVLESSASAAESRAEEANARVLLLEGRIAEIDSSLKNAQNSWSQAAASWEQEKQVLKDAHFREVSDLRANASKMKSEFEKSNHDLRLSSERVHKKLEETLWERNLADSEWKQRLDSLEKEKNKELSEEIGKRMDLERKLVVSYEKQSELRSRLEEEMTKTREIETSHKGILFCVLVLHGMVQTLERWWRRRLEDAEGTIAEREAELRRRLDAAALTTSEAVLDRTRLANDRLRLQAELRRRDDIAHEVRTELERRVAELEAANKELERKIGSLNLHHTSDNELQFPSRSKSPPFLLSRQQSNPTSDYTSDPEHQGSNGNLWLAVCGRSNNNVSPDLGIESDQGRLSSLDALTPSSPKFSHVGEIGKLELENSELRGQLQRTRKALEETFTQLNAANQRKRQVERAICRQLSKTHYILQKARTNLECSDQPTTSQL